MEWNNTNHYEPKIKIIIPVNKLSRKKAEMKVKEMMKLYNEDIELPDDVEIRINDNSTNNDIWFPDTSIEL